MWKKLQQVVRQTQVVAVAIVNLFIPKARRLVLHAYPDVEDQLVAVLRHILVQPEWNCPVVLLVSGSVVSARGKINRLVGPAAEMLVIHRKDSFVGMWAYWRSRYVFYTHGLYVFPVKASGQVVVNLWHGMPLKRIWKGVNDSPVPLCTWLLSTSAKYSTVQSEASGLPVARIPALGLPRNDLLFSRTDAVRGFCQRARAGVDRLVLFLPTYRRPRPDLKYNHVDGTETASVLAMSNSEAEELFVSLERTRTRLLVKAHPMSSHYGHTEKINPFVWVVTDQWFHEQGLTLYEALGQTDALFTDISSVYVDYLALRKPVFFYFPDIDQYRATRTFQLEPIEEWLAGPLCRSPQDLIGAWESHCAGRDNFPERRTEIAQVLNPQTQPGATAALMHLAFSEPGPTTEKTLSQDWAPIDDKAERWFSAFPTMAVRAGGLFVNFVTLALIGNLAGQQQLGLIVALNGAASVAGTIVALGFPLMLLRSMTGHLVEGRPGLAFADYKQSLRLVVAASALLMVFAGLITVGPKLSSMSGHWGSFGPIEILALGVGSSLMGIQFIGLSAVRALRMPAYSGFFQFCTQPLFLLVALSAVYFLGQGVSLVGASVAFTAGLLLNVMLVLLFVRRKTGKIETSTHPFSAWGELRPMWALSVLSVAFGNIPLLLVAMMHEPSNVAALGIPFRICNLPMTVVSALAAYYAPRIREAQLKGNIPRLRRELAQSQWIGGLLVLPILILAVFFPEYTLSFFGLHNADGIWLLVLFASAQLIIASCGVSEQYLAMLEKSSLATRYTLIFMLLTAVPSVLAHEQLGLRGLGVVWAACAVARQLALRFACTKATVHFRDIA